MIDCLIIDDEKELADATCEYFQMFGVSTHALYSATECREFLKHEKARVILLDINLGEESGFSLCKELRESLNVPILFVSARQSDDDVLIALNIGGDDYIKKPYTLSVLLAKVNVVLKRFREEKEEQIGEIVLQRDRMCVQTAEGIVELKAREFQLFSYLYDNKGRVIPKEELFREVWGDGFYGDGTLNVHIRKLREKIEKDPNNPVHIKTIWGTGYVFQP